MGMARIPLLLVVATSVGFFVAFYTLRGHVQGALPAAQTVPNALSDGAQSGATTEHSELNARLTALERALAVLADEVATLRETAADGGAEFNSTERSTLSVEAERRALVESNRSRIIAEAKAKGLLGASNQTQEQRLADAGFSQQRIAWITSRVEQLRQEGLRRREENERNGEPMPPVSAGIYETERALRADLGELEYERYLDALGLPTAVDVVEVLAGSPAEEAGFRIGDEIIRYDGRRIYSSTELSAMTLEGAVGQPVVVEVRREAGLIQLVLPRGRLGVVSNSGFGNLR